MCDAGTALVPTTTMTDELEDTDSSTDVDKQAHTGASIKGKMKMGSGTRDQATVVLKGKGEDASEATEEFEEALDAAENGDWGHRLLQLNPERSSATDDASNNDES